MLLQFVSTAAKPTAGNIYLQHDIFLQQETSGFRDEWDAVQPPAASEPRHSRSQHVMCITSAQQEAVVMYFVSSS